MLLEVGRVSRAHGIKGEVLVELLSDRTERVAPGAQLATKEGRQLTVIRSSPHHRRWIIAFEGVGDRSAAEHLHGAVLYAEPIEDAEAFWVHELIGSTVVDPAGRTIGVVASVEANPASDLLVLEGGGLIPIRFVIRRRPRQLTVDVPEGLLEL